MHTRMPVVVMGCSLAAALAVVGPVGAQTDGAVTFDVQGAGGPNGPHTMTQYFKGSQMRMDMNGAGGAMGSMTMMMDASTGTMTMLMPTQKMYMQYNIADLAGTLPAQDKGQLTVTPGGKETVAGISCTDYTITAASGTSTRVCAAPGVPSMDPKAFTTGPMAQYAARMGMSGQVMAALQQLKGKGVLKVSTTTGNGAGMTMVATKVDPTSPPASMFQVPAGYTKFSMPAGAMQGAPGGAAPKAP